MMKKSIGILLALAGFAAVGGILGENDKGNATVFRTFNEPPRIQKALSGATTTQPTDIYPDDGNATFPISQIYVSGNANEGKPTSLYASGRPLLITEGTIAGATTLYSNGSTTPLVTEWGVTSGNTSVTSTNPVTFYPVKNVFENYVAPSGTSGCSFFGGKMPASCTASNLLSGDISIRMTGGQANWLVCGGGTKTTGSGLLELEGGSAKEAMGDWGSSSLDKSVSKGVTINVRNDYSITYLAGSSTGNTTVAVNLYDSPWIQRSYLSTIANKRLNVGNVLSAKSKIGLLSPNQSFSSSSDSTAITEGTQLVYAADESYLANYKAIFSMFSSTTSSGTAIGYAGTKGEIVKSGNYLIYTYPITRVSAPTPTSTYSKGVISGLSAGETYLLTDSAGTVHTFVADANGKITIDKTSNSEMIDKTVSSLVQVRNDSQTDNSAAQSVSYTMPATLATPAISYANETLSGLVEGYDYTFTFSDGTSATVAAADHSTSLSVLLQGVFYGKTITGVVRKSSNGDEVDSLSESVSIAVPTRYATPDSTFAEGVVGSLKASSSYQLTYTDSAGSSHTKTISTTGDGDYVTYKDSDLAGMTITGIALVGDGGGLTSLPDAVAYPVPSQYAVVAPTYDAATHVLSGLSAKATYIVTDSTGATHEISTGDTTSLPLAEHAELAGLTIASVQQKGDGISTITSDKQASSLNYEMPTRRKDDGSLASLGSTSYDQSTDTLKGLTASTRYVVTSEDGTSAIITSDAEGKVDLSAYSGLVGKTITSVALKGTNADGDNTDYCDSLSVATSYKVLPHEAVGTPSFDSSSLVLNGLTPNVVYVLSDNNGTTYTATTDSDGKLDLASLTDPSGKAINGGTKLVSLVAKGDQASTIDSYSTNLANPITLPSREKTPSTSYEEDVGLLTGFDSNADYKLTYTQSDGTSGTLNVRSTSSGLANILDYPELENSTITGIQKLPTSSGMMISASEKTSYRVNSGAEILASKKDYVKKRIATAYAQAIANASVTDKDALTKALADVLARYDKAVDDLPYTDQSTFASDTDALVKKAEEECVYEIKKEAAIEQIDDLKRSCADDEKVNAVIAVYQKKLGDLQFGKDPDSAIADVVSEAKKAVELQTRKSAAETTMANASTSGMTNDEKALYDTYVGKIDAATSESEVASLLNEYQFSLTSLKAQEAAATQKNYAVFGYVILGVYVLFYAVYFGILRRHHVDGIYVIAWAAELILLVTVSLLVKGTNPLVLALLWAFYAVSIPLPFFFKNKDKDHQSPEKKAEAK